MSIQCAQPQWQAVVAHFNPCPQKTEADQSSMITNNQGYKKKLGGGGGKTRQKAKEKRKKAEKKNVLNHSGIYRTEGRFVNKLK